MLVKIHAATKNILSSSAPFIKKYGQIKGGRHSGERYKVLLKNLGFQDDLAYVTKWHYSSSR